MPIDVEHWLSPEGAIARRLDDFESRPQQIEMASIVERTLDARGHLVIEAGTGTGKSFAYLLPAIKRVVEHQERVVIVTNTIALQEQLVEKDVPLLNAVVPEEFSAVLVKGRGNYVSLRRLQLASERQERLLETENARHALHVIEDWAYTTEDGTLSTLQPVPPGAVWDLVRSDNHNCMGRKCPRYDSCFYQAARRRMEHGDLLICNHALFFSDLALRQDDVGFLPPYDHVIIDEAHRVEEVAAEHFGLRFSEAQVGHLLGLLFKVRSNKGFLTTLRTRDGAHALVDRAIEQTLTCRNRLDALCQDLLGWQGAEGPANGRIVAPDPIVNELSPALAELSNRLRLLREETTRDADEFELNGYSVRAADLARSLDHLLSHQIDDCVYWLEGGLEEIAAKRTRRNRRRNLELRCVAIDVGPVLKERLFSREVSVVLTSATLATGHDDFEHVRTRLGCADATTMQLGSPFDYASQMQVLVDPHMPEPSHPGYVERLAPRIREQVEATDGGAFVLFTSFSMLRRVADTLREPLAAAGHPVLVHGEDGPPGLLVRRFRMDDRSVLFGTASFWQGVDVRGRGLRNVIITRLPFDVPSRPWIEARHERIAEEGGHPFMDDQVPRAIIRFKQGIGRLIRSHRDEGRIVVLDPRIVTKRYGQLFLRALPDGVIINRLDAGDDGPFQMDELW